MTDSVTRAETDNPILEAKAAMTDFMRDFRAFQGRIDAKLRTQDDRISMLDRKAVGRPSLSAAAEAGAGETKAVSAYLRHGDETGVRAAALQTKGLSAATGADGGFLLDPQTSGRIAGLLRGAGTMRSLANIVSVQAGSYDVLVDRGDLGVAWATESGVATETAPPQFERISIPLHELSAMPRASQRLLEDAAFDVEGWLADAIAERFSRAENAAFVRGDGVDKPRGFLSYATAPTAAAAWGVIGYHPTGSVGGFGAADPANAIIDLIYSLGAKYRANATFVMNSKTAGTVRKMKDADGRFIWAEPTSREQPAILMGYPVLTCEEMPDIAPDATAVAFGDFRAGYTIAERPDLRILRDPYSAKPHVQFYAAMRVGGDVTDFSAIRLLKFSAA
jgi:HK97 family phage major capsid protein